jgi:cyclopropane-fatty-acyl-phospholipid synthase
MARGDIGLGEEYIAGSWDSDNVSNLLSLSLHNLNSFEKFSDGNFLNRLGFVIHNVLLRRNSLSGAARNIKDHYDVGNNFYSLWLDRSMTYSSALYAGTDDLDQAQTNKYSRILSKLGHPRASILEIGCGWGGFAERAAADGHYVTGLTISPAQYEYASKRLCGAADIRLEDYRKSKGHFDAIVSIEMFEAVGERYWPDYFATLRRCLAPGAQAVIQTITIDERLFDRYRSGTDFIQQYIFPGGMLPSPSAFESQSQAAGLTVTDRFRFGPDYARTLALWRDGFLAGLPTITAQGFDARFARIWEFYLAYCEAGFDQGNIDVIQYTLRAPG